MKDGVISATKLSLISPLSVDLEGVPKRLLVAGIISSATELLLFFMMVFL